VKWNELSKLDTTLYTGGKSDKIIENAKYVGRVRPIRCCGQP
jgi:hypothetical protein